MYKYTHQKYNINAHQHQKTQLRARETLISDVNTS